MFNRPLKSVVVAALIAAMPGCTALVWRPACEDRAVQPQIAGIVRNYPKPGDRALVVRYKAIGDGTDVDLVVPLTADLKPAGPNAKQGNLCVVRFADDTTGAYTVAGGLTVEQMAEIAVRAASVSADRPGLGKHLNANEFSPVPGAPPARSDADPVHPDTVCLLAYRLNAAGEVVPVTIDRDRCSTRPIHLAADDRLVLVPATVARPPGDQVRDQAVAIAVTPLTVAGDIALAGVGVGFVAVVVGGVVVVCAVVAGVVIVCLPGFLLAEAIHPSGNSDNQTTSTDTTGTTTSKPDVPAITKIPIVIDEPTTQPSPG